MLADLFPGAGRTLKACRRFCFCQLSMYARLAPWRTASPACGRCTLVVAIRARLRILLTSEPAATARQETGVACLLPQPIAATAKRTVSPFPPEKALEQGVP